ncbi:hypothetical protein CHCC5027_3565 [Bacillus paralicheniformis]|uniref:hypothetical protein n=1 Tax=Bacillus paralicheniformis TaxID=1648923 RepID=UPI0011AAA86D|nr:hypothetical protein [Bacillus paralicheniformis]TWJ39652.1 hypothetical protein CHCC5027_3565 [Bacillus paralicheniformis]
MEDKKLFYLGMFREGVNEDGNTMTKEAEMFSVGIHRGIEYTEDDINVLAENFSAEEDIPVQLDHSESARDTVGYIKEVFSKDGKLMGKVEIIDEYAQERVKKGLMKKLSISFYLRDTEDGLKPHKLREVSLVAFPQVKGARLFSENGYVSNYEESEGGKNDMSFDIEKFKEEVRKNAEADARAKVQEEFNEYKQKAERLEEVEKTLKLSEVRSKIEKFQAENKVIPAQKDALETLLSSFNEDQLKMFDEFMKENKVADFSEQGEFDSEDGEEKDSRSKEQKELDSFYEEHVKKYGRSL